MSTRVTDVNGNPIETWDDVTRTYTDFRTDPDTVRPYTPEENARADAEATISAASLNEAALLLKARDALASNSAFLAIASPTNAQTLAQVKALTRQVNGLIRLQLRELRDVSDT